MDIHLYKLVAQGKVRADFTLGWDCADGLGIVKKLSCFGQECRENRDDITWKKIAEVEYKTVDSKEGEAEAEDVNQRHHSEERVLVCNLLLIVGKAKG